MLSSERLLAAMVIVMAVSAIAIFVLTVIKTLGPV